MCVCFFFFFQVNFASSKFIIGGYFKYQVPGYFLDFQVLFLHLKYFGHSFMLKDVCVCTVRW